MNHARDLIMKKTPKKMGRPPMDPRFRKVQVSVKLPGWLVMWTSRQKKPRSILIEEALQAVHGLLPPQGKK